MTERHVLDMIEFEPWCSGLNRGAKCGCGGAPEGTAVVGLVRMQGETVTWTG